MTTYGDVLCVDCESCLQLENARAYVADDLIKIVADLRLLSMAVRNIGLHPDVIVIDGVHVDLNWFLVHGQHRLEARTEYGDTMAATLSDDEGPRGEL